jgi:hypothetical protein
MFLQHRRGISRHGSYLWGRFLCSASTSWSLHVSCIWLTLSRNFGVVSEELGGSACLFHRTSVVDTILISFELLKHCRLCIAKLKEIEEYPGQKLIF